MYANKVENIVAKYKDADLKVAVMGCVVNGPGEAKEADLGIAGGKGAGLIIKKGQVIKTVKEEELLSEFEKELAKMTGEDISRISTYENEEGNKVIRIDLHGVKKKNAVRMISNIIALIRTDFILEVVHGFNHGTVIKEYIWNEMVNDRITGKRCPANNPGITYISVGYVA